MLTGIQSVELLSIEYASFDVFHGVERSRPRETSVGGMEASANRLITYSLPGRAFRRDQLDKSNPMMGNVTSSTILRGKKGRQGNTWCLASTRYHGDFHLFHFSPAILSCT